MQLTHLHTARRIAMLRQICCKVEDLTLNGPRVAPIHHSQSSVTSLRSGERISCLGGQKIEVRGKEERESVGGKVIKSHVPSSFHIH